MNWKEYRFPLLFILKFAAFYLALNLLYAWFIHHHHPDPDPMTTSVARQSAVVLGALGMETGTKKSESRPITYINVDGKEVLGVYEGCNGLNTAIVFVAFVLSFGRPTKKALWFIPLGFLIIHLVNLLRVIALYFVSVNFPGFFYFFHKYLFTAAIFVAIFILWYFWITRLKGFKVRKAAS